MQNGLSIALCCHNSALRITPTLERLQAQLVDPRHPWEILLIDNGSTDETAMIAQAVWHKKPIAPMRIIQEPNLGLSHARERALKEATYDFIGLIDDDNWVGPNWVEKVLSIFESDKKIAACGGSIFPVCEVPPPNWFNEYKGNYTIWDLYPKAQATQHPLCGAGLCLRKTAWLNLKQAGFQHFLSDRKGKALSSGGDFELGYALLLNDWTLWYDPALRLQHFIPKYRLNWAYLMGLREGFGRQSLVLEVYEGLYKALKNNQPFHPKKWWKEALKCTYHLIRHAYKGCFPKSKKNEGQANAALWTEQWGRFTSLFQEKHHYDNRYKHLFNAPWVTLKKKPTV